MVFPVHPACEPLSPFVTFTVHVFLCICLLVSVCSCITSLFICLFDFCLSFYPLIYLFIRSVFVFRLFVRPFLFVLFFFSLLNLLLVRLFVRPTVLYFCLFFCLISLLLVRSFVYFVIYSSHSLQLLSYRQIRPFAAELLSNTHGAGFQALRVTPDQLPKDRMLAEVVIHTAAVLQCMYRGSLVEPLRMLMEQPAGMNVRTIKRSRITDRTLRQLGGLRWHVL